MAKMQPWGFSRPKVLRPPLAGWPQNLSEGQNQAHSALLNFKAVRLCEGFSFLRLIIFHSLLGSCLVCDGL